MAIEWQPLLAVLAIAAVFARSRCCYPRVDRPRSLGGAS